MIKLRGKKVAVVGAGIEGMSSAKWLKEHGAEVTVLDKKESKDYLKNLEKYDLIVRSPGVKLSTPEIQEAAKKGIQITSQTKLFFEECPCPIIGVTGTKGKGTTANLIYEMLKKSFDPAQDKDAYLGGNIGSPPLDFLNKLSVQSIVVLELSSFQLQDINKSPNIAVLLMTTSEHLDYHKDVYEYVEAKRNLLRFQTSFDFAILNKDYPASGESDIHTKAKVFWVSREQGVEEGCFIRNGKVILRTLGKLGRTENQIIRQSDYQIHPTSRPSESSEFSETEIIDTKDILLPGAHNLENVCAAVMAATLAGVSKANIVKVLKTFKGLEHRLELIREVGGVRYYDDSFSTTPQATIAAIQAFKNPEILILGGSSKNSDFTELGRVISEAENIKAIIGIGGEWPKIKEEILKQAFGSEAQARRVQDDNILMVEGLKDMRSIVRKAKELAEPGDVVLLSPACASFDMFKNYKDRGEQFKQAAFSLNF